MFSTALRPPDGFYVTNVQLLPSSITLQHFEGLITNTNFLTYYLNSIILSLGVIITTTVAGTLGGYGLARIDIPRKKTFARGILFGYMFPPILLSIPMYIFWRQINILNTYIGAILAMSAIALPFSLWLMWQFFQTVPFSLEESAQMSGATRFQAFRDVALPVAKPGVIAIALFGYAVAWNSFTIPLILLPSNERWPLTVGIQFFQTQHGVVWGQLFAASILMLIPSFLFVYFLQKYLLRGFRLSGIG
jgi:multiple sugar transport system permease protein